MKVVRLVYFWTIFFGLLVAMVAVGTPRSAFIVLFIILGIGLVVYRVIPFLIEYGLPRLLRSRSDSEVDRIQTVVGGVFWVGVFIVAPIMWNAYFGGPDPPVSAGDLLGFVGGLLWLGTLIAVVWLVVALVRRRRRSAKRPEQAAEPREDFGLFPGVVPIAKAIAWLLERREARRLKQAKPRPRLP